ncbi:transcription factor 15-like [Dreissena polymorpha]|nr:transcription factor 15-like [Dreissena polymorpha]
MTSFEKRLSGSCHRLGTRRRHKRSGKVSYKHIPHSEKPPHLVAKRNARERRRVETVNNAFVRLRRHVPIEAKNKRLSKVKTLRYAIDYIKQLTIMIKEHDKQYGSPCLHFGRSVSIETIDMQQELRRPVYFSREYSGDATSGGPWYQSG